jgi:hypothetical protein
MAQSENKGGILAIDYSVFNQLYQAMQNFHGSTENAINDILHNYAGDRAQKDILRLMPKSNKTTGTHAKNAKSLENRTNVNLAVTVGTKSKFGYLYFPDDGTNTINHVGNQRFFERGGEAAMPDIIERCITRLTQDFEKGE